jgi:hypothetical protein
VTQASDSAKHEESTAVVKCSRSIEFCVVRKPEVVADDRKLVKFEVREESKDLSRRVHAVGVEADTWTADRKREIQQSTGSEDTLQLDARAARPVGGKIVSVTPKTHMLGYVKAGKRTDRARVEWKTTEEISCERP